jgi:hypothetical protein
LIPEAQLFGDELHRRLVRGQEQTPGMAEQIAILELPETQAQLFPAEMLQS